MASLRNHLFPPREESRNEFDLFSRPSRLRRCSGSADTDDTLRTPSPSGSRYRYLAFDMSYRSYPVVRCSGRRARASIEVQRPYLTRPRRRRANRLS